MKYFLFIAMAGWLAASTIAKAQTNAFSLRIGSGEVSLDNYQAYGYNAAIVGDVIELATFDDVYPGVIAPGSDLGKRIEHAQRKFQRDADQANKLGLAVCLLTDEVSLPVPVLKQLQKSSAPDGFDLDSPQFWKVYRAKYREVLKKYPQVACVIVRTGENYSHPEEGFMGHTVLDLSGGYNDQYFRYMQRLIEETREVVVDECGRTLIWRTWDLGDNGFHANPQVYDRVVAGLTNRTGLLFAIKHTQTDFWRYDDFNTLIERGGIPAVVEFQCAREYEGKGAFPDYVAPLHAVAMQRARDLGAPGVWVWDFGGGWGGPLLKSDRWVRLNIYATARLAQDPDLSPRDLAQEWAAQEFGVKASTNVAAMLMLSGDCVRECMYIKAFARGHSSWKPSLNLMRDDIIRGEALKQLYDGSKESLSEVFEEKEQAVALAANMRSLFESSRDDIVAARGQQVYDESLGSLIYLQDLANVMCHYVNGMFSFYHWQETHDPSDAARAREELQAWNLAWQNYQTEVPGLPGAATLYRSQNTQSADSATGAMADLCQHAMQKLAALNSNHSSTQTAQVDYHN